MFEELILSASNLFELDPKLIKAIIQTESGGNEFAIRHEPDYAYLYSVNECAKIVKCTRMTMIVMQKSSWGLMQIMGAVYYENIAKNPNEMNYATVLLNPKTNLRYGCSHLRSLIDRHKVTMPEDIYAVFNAGSIRRKPDGKLFNQANVDRFMEIYKSLN